MPLIGGGGAGNVTGGANPAGIGIGLNYVGNYAYAYSGTFPGSTTTTTILDTNSGSEIIVGEFQLNACVATGSPNVGLITGADIEFDGQVIARIKADGQAETTPASETQKVVIPPYTRITVKVDADDNQAGRLGTVTFTGRTYA
jgi:hypothetical protein